MSFSRRRGLTVSAIIFATGIYAFFVCFGENVHNYCIRGGKWAGFRIDIIISESLEKETVAGHTLSQKVKQLK